MQRATYIHFVSFLFLVILVIGLAVHAPPLQAGSGSTVPMLVQGHVDLQRPNAPPPDPSWSVPISITLSAPGTTDIRYTWQTTTDESGNFSLLETFEPGTYDVRVKNIHTLRNVKYNVLFTSGSNTLDLGALREGDANNDNRVNVADFTLLRNAYFAEEGQAGFDPRTDFDEDNRVNVRDFALLRSNYFKEGDIVVSARWLAVNAEPVLVYMRPQRVRLQEGVPTEVVAWLDTRAWGIVGADTVVTFDPALLQVVTADGIPTDEVLPGDALDTVLTNKVDNVAGRITFGAGTFGSAVQGWHTLFRFYLLGLQKTIDAALTFSYVDVVDAGGRSLPTEIHAARVQVGAFSYVYVPALVRSPRIVRKLHVPFLTVQAHSQ